MPATVGVCNHLQLVCLEMRGEETDHLPRTWADPPSDLGDGDGRWRVHNVVIPMRVGWSRREWLAMQGVGRAISSHEEDQPLGQDGTPPPTTVACQKPRKAVLRHIPTLGEMGRVMGLSVQTVAYWAGFRPREMTMIRFSPILLYALPIHSSVGWLSFPMAAFLTFMVT